MDEDDETYESDEDGAGTRLDRPAEGGARVQDLTHKTPTANIPTTASFCRLGSLRGATMGMGRMNIRTSVPTANLRHRQLLAGLIPWSIAADIPSYYPPNLLAG